MKKLLSFLLLTMMIFTICACNKQQASPASEPDLPETPEEIAMLYAQMNYQAKPFDLSPYLSPDSMLYQQFAGPEGDSIRQVLSGEKSHADMMLEQERLKLADNGLEIADEEFVVAFYEKVWEKTKVSLRNAEYKDESKVSVCFLVENDLNHNRIPDFSVVSFENSDIDQLVENATVDSCYFYCTLIKIEDRWFLTDSMLETGTEVMYEDGIYGTIAE